MNAKAISKKTKIKNMRISKKTFKILALPIISVITLASFLTFSPYLARKTADDGIILRQSLENPRGQVLGINNQKSQDLEINKCPKILPIIGWINYSGQKILKKELPIGQKPTVCFENIQIAQSEGYFEEVEKK